MTVQPKDNHGNIGISKDKIYEVLAMQSVRKSSKWQAFTVYYLYNDNNDIDSYHEIDFDIVNNKFDKDFIVTPDEYDESLLILPESIPTSFFNSLILENDVIFFTKEFWERFKHLVSQHIYEEILHDEYQSKDLYGIAEPIGEDWVLCGGCDAPFQVVKKQGVVKCPSCYFKQNNPYSKKLGEK